MHGAVPVERVFRCVVDDLPSFGYHFFSMPGASPPVWIYNFGMMRWTTMFMTVRLSLFDPRSF